MDLRALPCEVVAEIRSYVVVVSWRAEAHFSKLLKRYMTFKFEDLPPGIFFESSDCYIYRRDTLTITYVYKERPRDVNYMKNHAIERHLMPLQDYLNNYRKGTVERVWHPSADFYVLRTHVSGKMTASFYRYMLMKQSEFELGVSDYRWVGNVPYKQYKQACTSMLRIVRYFL
jgi:hypothetical protein